MDLKITGAAETLVFSGNQDNTNEQRVQLINSIKVIDDFLTNPNADPLEFNRALNVVLFALLKTLQNADMNVWSLAEQTLIKIVKTHCIKHFDIILPEIWKGVKGSEVTFSIGSKKTKVKLDGRSRRTSLEIFSYILPYIHNNSVKNFISSIIRVLVRIGIQNDDQLLQESIANNFAPIVKYQLSNCSLSELKQIIGIFVCNATSQHGSVRRAGVSCLTTLFDHHEDKTNFINLIIKYSYNILLKESAIDDIENAYNILSSDLDKQELVDKIPSILERLPATLLQGFFLLHKHLLRSSLKITKETKFIFKNSLLEELPFLFNFACSCLNIVKENNTVVSSLELLDDILKYFLHELLNRLHDSDKHIANLFQLFSNHLFNKESRISSQVLIMQSLSSLSNVMTIQFQQFIKDNFDNILKYFNSSDPLLRGQTYLFIGAFINGWLSCNEKIEWDLDVIGLLSKVLQSTYEDEATVSSKMACESISSVINTLLYSQYSHFVIFIIQHFLDMPPNAYTLVKSKIISLFSKIDYGVVSLIEEKLRLINERDSVTCKFNSFGQSLEISVLNFIISFLNEEDTKLRQKACKCLVKMIPNLYRPEYFKDSKVSTNNFYKLSIYRYTELKRTKVQNKENIYFLLSQVIPYINQYSNGSFMKGFFYFLRTLLENENYLHINFIDIILEQLTCYSSVLDLETQLDITVLVSYIVSPKKKELSDYNNILFTHVLKLLNIFYHIVGGYHSPAHKFKVGKGSLKGSIQDHPLYMSIWERLSDLFRLSQSTLNETIYDDFFYHTLDSMDRMITSLGHHIIPYVDELILYSGRFFENHTEKIVEMLYSIAKSTLTDSGNSKITEKSKILTSFERIFSKCVIQYSQVLCVDTKLKILSLIHLLISEGINYKSVDKDNSFLKLLHHQLIRGTQEHIKSKDKSDEIAIKSITYKKSSKILVYQLCIVLELHVKKDIPITGLPLSSFDIPLIAKSAFDLSWHISTNYDAFKILVDIVFSRNENLEDIEDSSNDNVFKEDIIPKIKKIIIESVLELFPQPNSDDLIVHIYRYLKGTPKMDEFSLLLLKAIQDLLLNKDKYYLVTLMNAIEFYNLFRVIDLIPQHLLTCDKLCPYFTHIKDEKDISLMCLVCHIISRIEPEEILNEKENIFKVLTNNIYNAISLYKGNESKAVLIGMLDSIIIILHNFLVSTHDVNQYFNIILNDDTTVNHIINRLINSSNISVILKMCDIALSINSPNFFEKIISKTYNSTLWFKDIILGVALSHYMRLIKDSPDVIKDVIRNNDYLELIIEFIDDSNVMSVLRNLNSLKLEDHVVNFIKEKMKSSINLPQNYIHKLLALSTHVKPSKDLLIMLIETFMVSPFLSVVISCERFVLRYLERYNMFESSLLTDEIILDVVEQYEDTLRSSFVKKVRDINWLMSSPSTEKKQHNISQSLQENFTLSLTPQDIYILLRQGPTEKPKIINNVNKILFDWILDKKIDSNNLITLRSAEEVQNEYKGLLPFEQQLEHDNAKSDDNVDDFLTFNFDSFKNTYDDDNSNKDKEHQYAISEWLNTIDMVKAISLSLYRFSGWSDRFAINSYSLSGVLIELAIYVLDMASYFYYNAIEYISTIEIIHIISFLKYLFSNFEFTLEKIMEEEKLKTLIHKLFDLYIIVHGTNNKIKLDEGIQVQDILQFFWEYLRNRHLDSFHFEHRDMSVIEEHYYSLIKSLAQSSASLENEIYLFQDTPINYDFNNEPVEILEKFLYLINSMPPVFPETFMKIWKQILMGIDPKSKILPIATSEKIKVLSVRALTSLLYKTLINLDNVYTIGNGPKDRLTYIPIMKVESMKENLIYLWKGLNLSSLIDEYIDFLMPHLIQFLYYTTTEPSLGKESLRSVVILSDFLVLNQRNHLLNFFNDNLENLQDVDDPFIKEYLVLGLCKLLSITWGTINTDTDLLSEISQKVVLILRNFISLQNLRRNDIPLSEKPIIPIVRSMILFSLNYLVQDKRIFNFAIDPTIYPFLKKLMDNEVKILYETKTSHLLMLNLVTKSPSMLVKHLAKSCISSLGSSKDKLYY